MATFEQLKTITLEEKSSASCPTLPSIHRRPHTPLDLKKIPRPMAAIARRAEGLELKPLASLRQPLHQPTLATCHGIVPMKRLKSAPLQAAAGEWNPSKKQKNEPLESALKNASAFTKSVLLASLRWAVVYRGTAPIGTARSSRARDECGLI